MIAVTSNNDATDLCIYFYYTLFHISDRVIIHLNNKNIIRLKGLNINEQIKQNK